MQNKAISFEKGNVKDLKNKLQYLLEHEEIIKEYKENSQRYVCEKYNWDDIVKKTIKLYQNKC